MTDIKKILDEIDSYFGKPGYDSSFVGDELIAIFPTLRDYIARLERESEAGKTALERFDNLDEGLGRIGNSGTMQDNLWREGVQKIISSYRTSCEGKEK